MDIRAACNAIIRSQASEICYLKAELEKRTTEIQAMEKQLHVYKEKLEPDEVIVWDGEEIVLRNMEQVI